MTDWNKVESLCAELLKEISSDPTREGLVNTPHRMAKYFKEMLSGEKKKRIFK